jgi:hypothetical protein
MSIFNDATDYFEKANNAMQRGIGDLIGQDPVNGYSRNLPTANGSMSRQAQINPNRIGTTRRQMMRFIVPEQPIVDMYVNPKQIIYQYKKQISSTRTKGGFALQYWGENLTNLAVNGTTGTSGIEGINVLLDVYRNEQLMFDPYALMLEAARDKEETTSFDNELFGNNGILGLEGGILSAAASMAGDFLDSAQNQNILNSRNKPTLASLAFTVEIYWCGEVYRGFFDDFNITESAENLGLFDYSFNFKVTQKRGFRSNYLAWHKDPNHGPSNWGQGGPPKSYAGLQSSNVGVIKTYASGKNINILNKAMEESMSFIDAFNM